MPFIIINMGKSKPILLIFGIILILGIIIGGIVYFGLIPQTAISVGTFTCSPHHKCEVTPILDCTIPEETQTPEVIARTDDTDYSQGWLALKNEYGNLESWTRTSSLNYETIGHEICTGSNKILLPYDKYGCTYLYRPSKFLIFDKFISDSLGYFVYEKGGSGDVNPSIQYDCQGRELCSNVF